MGVLIGGVDFEKVVEAINAQAAALEALKRRVREIEEEIARIPHQHEPRDSY